MMEDRPVKKMFANGLTTYSGSRTCAAVCVKPASSGLPNTKRNAKLSQITSLVTPALLDIYFATDSNDILMNLKNRQRWVNRNAKFDYRQRQLFGLRDAPQQHARLSKEIDGFLRRLF